MEPWKAKPKYKEPRMTRENKTRRVLRVLVASWAVKVPSLYRVWHFQPNISEQSKHEMQETITGQLNTNSYVDGSN